MNFENEDMLALESKEEELRNLKCNYEQTMKMLQDKNVFHEKKIEELRRDRGNKQNILNDKNGTL